MQISRRYSQGFTLIEMMVTVIVLSVLLAVAVPNFRDVIRRGEVTSTSNALLADVSYARTEAITRGNIVSICPSSDGTNCTADETAYEDGWLVYTYTAGRGVAATAYVDGDANNLLLRYTGARSNASIQAQNGGVVSFGSQGQTRPAGAVFTFDTCYRAKGTTGNGSSTSAVPGTRLRVNGSGGVTSTGLAADAECSP